MERRLAAIPAADAVGYSRLVAADEEGTIARLKAALEELIEPGIARHSGRIVKTMGDGLSAEFPSVVDAVRSAVETRRAMAKRAAAAPDDRRIVLRMGMNLGDIVVEGEDILEERGHEERGHTRKGVRGKGSGLYLPHEKSWSRSRVAVIYMRSYITTVPTFPGRSIAGL